MRRTKEVVSIMAPSGLGSRRGGEEKQEKTAPFPGTDGKDAAPQDRHRKKGPPPAGPFFIRRGGFLRVNILIGC